MLIVPPARRRGRPWISFDHFTARPSVDIERHDEAGRTYTETREVPSQVADPQLHTHVGVPPRRCDFMR
jgi:hypothetical protein